LLAERIDEGLQAIVNVLRFCSWSSLATSITMSAFATIAWIWSGRC